MIFALISYTLWSCSMSAASGSCAKSPRTAPSPPPPRRSPSRSPRCPGPGAQQGAPGQPGGGGVRGGAPAPANATLIPLAIRAFDDAHPEVHLRLDEAVSSDLVERLSCGELDIAIVAN